MLQSLALLRKVEIRNVQPFYQTRVDRTAFYQRIAEIVVDRAARRGLDIVYLTAGNPFVMDDPVLFMRALCREQPLPLRIIPSMSFLDTVLAPIGGLDGRGLSIFLARAIVIGARRLDPEVPTLLAQLGDWSAQGIAVEDLSAPRAQFLDALGQHIVELYPAGHRVYVLQASLDPADYGRILSEAMSVGDLSHASISAWANLYIPPRHSAA